MTSSTSSSIPEAENSDRISGMPDDVLVHILSFLPTTISAKTSILSRRWRFLWAYAPNLIFKTDDDVDSDIVYRVMLLRRSENINTLRMTGCFPCTELQFDTWIAYAVMRDVRNLDLWVSGCRILPQCLLNCKTLVDLRLTNCSVIPEAGPICLPCLKNLHLIHARYESDESLPHLLSGCTMLEEFVLMLDEDSLSCYNISSPTIKRLTVHFHFSDSTSYECRLVIDTPALGYLEICDHFGKFAPLIDAEIHLEEGKIKKYDFLYCRSILNFIDWLGILNPKSMRLNVSAYLSEQTAESEFFAGNISFPTLTKLEVVADCFLVSQFLKKADNLEILIFHEVSEEVQSYVWVEPPQVPKCLLSHLRVVKFAFKVNEMNNFALVGFLLKNARVLEEMEVQYSGTSDTDEKINEMGLIERASKKCSVTFVKVVYR
ncbi:PREDICTED: F-box/LRR-repeat protein At3g26922-like isoform X1 [Erythranthe guttata]|nr:PREDICTED: F-box/LRR-repeat protein At3g26922-like isoform X1 [Erythranthe guttata]XP_012846652.1 PREDICTED: F-box/LRR-repeat protein At3g26922-like isoform X1 [Erythranthe guttata]|eukprot:XP_012846651.1 PREDICTED: F-box/LRR-repeat protein At3g26922-like isoform X1 [Erythranthe guttata]